MRRLSFCKVLAVGFFLLPLASQADDAVDAKATETKEDSPRGTMQFTKSWTDGYGNYQKEVYFAYFATAKNMQGEDIEIEIKHGPITVYHENGKKSLSGKFRDGRREGEYLYWSENGTKTGEANFKDGEMHGVYRQWDDDGRQMREETYDRGRLHGEARWWDTDGKLLVTGTYRDDKPWSGKFVQLESQPVSMWLIKEFVDGKVVSNEKMTAKWWW